MDAFDQSHRSGWIALLVGRDETDKDVTWLLWCDVRWIDARQVIGSATIGPGAQTRRPRIQRAGWVTTLARERISRA